ncbi:MAG: glycosyl transferase [Pseudomonadota bacterium]
MRVAFFGHDAYDAAIRRRIKSFHDDGLSVDGFMMRRGPLPETAWTNYDLGETRPGAFIHRAKSIFSGTKQALKHREALAAADIIYARNLDMMAVAVRVKNKLNLDLPIVYECLDVHRLLCRDDFIGSGLRGLERRLLRASSALVVSSPAFLEHHFERHYAGTYDPVLIENRLTDSFTGGERPNLKQIEQTAVTATPLRLGWVGVLRCQRSLDLLCETARRLGPKVEIRIHGIVAETEIPNFDAQIEPHANMRFFGRYRAPEDLSEIYGNLDIVWSGDFMEAGFNSVWLLPNRIYEGGYYGTPAVSPDQTQTAQWIAEHDCGFAVAEPLESQLPQMVERLASDPSQIEVYRRQLARLPMDVFVQPAGLMRTTLERVVARYRQPPQASTHSRLEAI